MAFTQKTINAFEMNQRAAACEIASSRVGYRSFIGVYPPRCDRQRVPSPIPNEHQGRWCVKKFTIPERLINEYFAEDDLADRESVYLNTMAEVEDLLTKWGVDSAKFDAPWASDYPL